MKLAPISGHSRSIPGLLRFALIAGAATLIVVCLVSSGGAAAATFSVPSPVAGGWQLNGSAVLNTGASPPNLQLTPATNNEAGSAFYPTAIPGVGISAAFDVFIGSGDGADGLTFTLANASDTQPTALGVSGGGEGFSGITGIAVSLDTWQNSVNPSNNFIGIANGPVSGVADELNYVTTNTSIPAIRNTVHTIVVTTTSTGITVTMDGTQVLTYATTLPPDVLVGFTGGTGGVDDIHQVQNVTITSNAPSPAPTVSAVSPTSGPSTGGTSVTVTGTGFTGASAVQFGTTAATSFTVNSATSITATSPAGSGTVNVTVTTPGGTSATSAADQFSYAAATFSVPSPVAGGWQLNGSAVLNTGTSPPNLQLTPATNNEAGSAFYPTAIPGVGISAAFDVFIGSGDGADGLTFTLANASDTQPTALGVSGGGEGFSGITGIAVSLDTWQNSVNPSNNFIGIANGPVSGVADELNYVTTNTSIPAIRNTVHTIVVTTTSTGITVTMDGTQVLTYATTLPPDVLVGFTGGTGGVDDIHQVQNVTITSNAPSPAPTVSAVSPTSGPSTGGTSVTVTGTGFTGASAVQFGTTAATSFTVNSATSITATSPAGSGTVNVTVTTPGGTSATSVADQFAYVAAPIVSSVSPSSGPQAGGTSVTVTGTALTGATAVKFGTTAATSFTVNSATSITATSPVGSGHGQCHRYHPGGNQRHECG